MTSRTETVALVGRVIAGDHAVVDRALSHRPIAL